VLKVESDGVVLRKGVNVIFFTGSLAGKGSVDPSSKVEKGLKRKDFGSEKMNIRGIGAKGEGYGKGELVTLNEEGDQTSLREE